MFFDPYKLRRHVIITGIRITLLLAVSAVLAVVAVRAWSVEHRGLTDRVRELERLSVKSDAAMLDHILRANPHAERIDQKIEIYNEIQKGGK